LHLCTKCGFPNEDENEIYNICLRIINVEYNRISKIRTNESQKPEFDDYYIW